MNKIFYGWFVLVAGFFILFVSAGARNGLGFFVVPMTEEFDWSRKTISLAFGIGWFANAITQPFIGRLHDKLGGRIVISISVLIIGISSISLSFTNSLWFLIITYGIIMSIASGGASLVTIHAVLARWFHRRRGMAISLATSGASAGSLIIAPFTAYVILLLGWRITWGVLGVMILAVGLPMALLIIRNNPSETGDSPDGDTSPVGNTSSPSSISRLSGHSESDSWTDALRSLQIWQLTGAYFVCGITTAIISFHYVPFALDQGFSIATAGLAFGLMNGLNLVGVLSTGFLSDKVSRKSLLAIVYAVRALAFVMLIFAPSVIGLWSFAIIAGLSWAASAHLTSSITADIYGVKTMGTIVGFATLAHQMGGAISIYLAGLLYDIYGSYDVAFFISATLLVAASVASYLITNPKLPKQNDTLPVRAKLGTGM